MAVSSRAQSRYLGFGCHPERLRAGRGGVEGPCVLTRTTPSHCDPPPNRCKTAGAPGFSRVKIDLEGWALAQGPKAPNRRLAGAGPDRNPMRYLNASATVL